MKITFINPPTYSWDEILAECAEIDIIVRGEGERTALLLMQAISRGEDLRAVDGIAFRENGVVVGMRWYTKIGRRVWFHEVAEYLFRTKLLRDGPTLREFVGSSLAAREYALSRTPGPPSKASDGSARAYVHREQLTTG